MATIDAERLGTRRLLRPAVSRVAAGVTVLFLLLQAATTLGGALQIDAQGHDAQVASRRLDLLIDAHVAADEEAEMQGRYLLQPTGAVRASYRQAVADFGDALTKVTNLPRTSTSTKGAIARIQREHLEHVGQTLQLFSRRDAGDDGLVRANALIDIRFDRLTDDVAALAAAQRRDLRARVGDVRQTEGWLVRLTPVGLALCLAMLLVRTAVIRAQQRARAEADARLATSAKWFQAVLEHSTDLILVLRPNEGITYVSPACIRLLGYPPDETASLDRRALFHPDDLPVLHAAWTRCVETDGELLTGIQARLRHHDGSWRWVEMSLANHLADPQVNGLVANVHDITGLKSAEADLSHQSTHDVLTGLPNRGLLLDRVEQALARSDLAVGDVAVLFCDLDGFNVMNDTLGHAAGDELLRDVATRLGSAVRPTDTIARFGADEFVVCCGGVLGAIEAMTLADALREALMAPFTAGDDEVFLTISVGIRVATWMTSAADLLRDAEVAMHQAKAAGRDRAVVYTDAMLVQSERRFRLGRDLRRAIEREELRVHYQPVVDMVTNQIIGVEALVRWEHPSRGLVQPVEFISVAEDTGLIEPLGLWVLERACRQLQAWEEAGAPPLHVAVNLSPRQLRSSTIVQDIADVIERTGVRSDRLFLEVTESALMDDPDAAARQLTALHELGIRLAIDDFGTGYSSLASLRRFPVDVLKIDRSFVTNVDREPEAVGIVTAIISLAQVLDLTTIAEGVETEEERAVLQQLGADLGQGYLWSRPIEADAMTAWLVAPVPTNA